MRLSCEKAFVLALTLTVACHESTTPPPLIAGVYLLESINSQPTPATVWASEGDTITVISGNLNLDGAGKAVLVEHVRFVHPNTGAGEATDTTGYVYRITRHRLIGYDVAFDRSPPCPPNALCVGPPIGRVVGSTLTLSYDEFATRPYLYRRAGLD